MIYSNLDSGEESNIMPLNSLEYRTNDTKKSTTIALMDFNNDYHQDILNPYYYSTFIFKIRHDDDDDPLFSPIVSDIFDQGELNLGNPTTLENFIESSMTKYPAKKYLLLIDSHGGSDLSLAGDIHPIYDDFTYDELNSVFQHLKEKNLNIDIVDFHSCMMGRYEIEYLLNQYNPSTIFIGHESIVKDTLITSAEVSGIVSTNPQITPEDSLVVLSIPQKRLQ